MRRGVLWQLPKLAHPTKDPVGSSLPTPTTQANMLCDSMSHSQAHRNLKAMIFPTPTASDGMRSNLTYGAGNLTLKGAVINQNWPTPTVNHIRNHNEPVKNYDKRVQDWKEGKTKGKPGISLGVAVRKFATPTVTDAANMPMRKVAKESLAKGNWRGIDLRTSAQLIPKQNYPTPTAREPNDIGINLNRGKYSNDTLTRKVSNLENLEVGGKLNPEWVEWLMGWPIGFTECEHVGTE